MRLPNLPCAGCGDSLPHDETTWFNANGGRHYCSKQCATTDAATRCSCCHAELDFEFYGASDNPRASKVAWDMRHFKLCEACLSASIIGYDHMDCEFQNLTHCKNPEHSGDLCLGYSCPYKAHKPRTSLLDELKVPSEE